MSRSPRTLLARLGLAFVLVALFGALVSPALGFQTPDHTGPPDPVGRPPNSTDVTQLPVDRQAMKKLRTAQEYIDAKLWAEAVKLLQAVVDLKEDSFIHVPADAAAKTPERTCSSREEASRMIGALPPSGLEAYAIAYHDPAQRMLTEAKTRRDPQLLQETVRRYRYTRPGLEALELLGARALDRGEFDLAAVCYQRLLERHAKDKPSRELLFKAALAFRFAGNTALERQTVQKLVTEIGNTNFKVGGRSLTAEQLTAEVARLPVPRIGTEDTLVYRRDRSRSGAGAGDFPYLEPTVHVSTVEQQRAKAWLELSLKATPANGVSVPPAVPIAVGDKLVYRSHLGVHALDARTGNEVWRTPFPLSLDRIDRDPGKYVQLENWFTRQYTSMRSALSENSVLGTLSSDGAKVYAIEDLPLPPHPNQIMMEQNGQKRLFGPLKDPIYHNKLRALDLATGAVVWEAGGMKAASRELSEAYFLGPPLPLGGNLFALMEKNSELRLVCLRAERGDVLWSQSLGTPREKILLDIGRRITAVHLAYDDGVLVCPTNSGLILGLDPMSRTLLWAYTYREVQPATDPNGGGVVPVAYDPVSFAATWKGSAPIIAGGRVVFTATDSDSVRCLDLRTGALLWKVLRTEEDLYVGAVRAGKVLIVGKNGSRLYSLANGSQLWQQQTDRPSGLGVTAGKYYYLPLEKGGLLALNLDNPKESAHLTAHSAYKPGNLVFHAGLLWSQDVLTLTAYPEMTAHLNLVEARLKANGRDPVALAERAGLRLDRGDVRNAAADYHAALANNPPNDLARKVREKLFATLTQLLGRDFTAGEKYLDEYRSLCKIPVPADAPEAERKRLETEQQKRQTQYYILVAHGRAAQGKLAEAVKAYRDLHERARSDELMAIPFDPAVQVRPERWVQTQIGVLVSQASDQQRALLRAELEKEWRLLSAGNDDAARERFGALFGAIPGPVGAPGRAALYRLAERHVLDANPRYALDAELSLHLLQEQADSPAFAARALYTRARLLTRQGLLEDATDCYRQLSKEYPKEGVAGGRTGVALFDDLATDKRFAPYLHEPRSPWVAAKLKAVESSGNFMLNKAVVSHEPHGAYYSNTVLAGIPNQMIDRRNPPPSTCRHLRFLLDVPNGQLHVMDRDSGAERWTLAMPVAGARQYIATGEEMVSYRAVDHLAVFSVGQFVVGVDLIERRVRWHMNLLENLPPNNRNVISAGTDGSVYVSSPDGSALFARYGLVGPVSLTGCYVQTSGGLAAVDLATGQTRWLRSDVPTSFEMFGDDEFAYLVEFASLGDRQQNTALRAFRVSDGVSVEIPEVVGAFAGQYRTTGRHVLGADRGQREELVLRLYDMQTGKDLWKKTYPAGSLVLDSNTPDYVGVAVSKGHVEMLDPLTGNELQRLKVDPQAMQKALTGVLLRDRTQFYVGFQLPKGPNANVDDGPNPSTGGDIVSLPVNGMLYAYDRATGSLRWGSLLKYQMIVTDHFDEMPILLCSAMTQRGAGAGGSVMVTATVVLDKKTGKKRYHKETVNNGEMYHTLQINARAGTIEFVSMNSKVRFAMEK